MFAGVPRGCQGPQLVAQVPTLAPGQTLRDDPPSKATALLVTCVCSVPDRKLSL